MKHRFTQEEASLLMSAGVYKWQLDGIFKPIYDYAKATRQSMLKGIQDAIKAMTSYE